MAFINPADKGVQVTYPLRPDNSTYDVGGQQVNPEGLGMQGTPIIDYGHPGSVPQDGGDSPFSFAVAHQHPIMNGTPQAHPIQHVAQLITDHANLLRQRLMAAHMHGGFAPEAVSERGMTMPNPLDLVHQTRGPNKANLAQLLARFQKGLRPNIDPGFSGRTDMGGDFLNPHADPYHGRH